MTSRLWQADKNRQINSNIYAFIQACEQNYHLKLTDYWALYQWSIEQPDKFWQMLFQFSNIIADNSSQRIIEKADTMIKTQWFPDCRLNYAENLLRVRPANETVLIYQNESGHNQQLCYQDLYQQVSLMAQALADYGIESGDCVAAVLPNIPETIIAMLATASIGAVWSSCSPDFGNTAIIDRLGQLNPKVLLLVDQYHYNGHCYQQCDRKQLLINAFNGLKLCIQISQNPQAECETDRHCLNWQQIEKNYDINRLIEFKRLPFSAPLFVLFSSGTTGPPKCIIHGIGGTLLQHCKEHLLHVDLHPGDRIFYYTTCGWMMWNWLASALAVKATLVLYDGNPMYPNKHSLFSLIDRYRISVFGVSARYLTILKQKQLKINQYYALTSLKTILSTGSPLSKECFDYAYQSIKNDMHLASISGGSDIISCFVLGCPLLPVFRGEIQVPGLGMRVEIFNEQAEAIQQGKGELVCSQPFPSMPVGLWNDPDQSRYLKSYFKRFEGVWYHADYASWTQHRGMIIHGRSDATLNPGGIRIGTAEIYRLLESMDEITDSLITTREIEHNCQIVLFIILKSGLTLDKSLKQKIISHIRQQASPHHVPGYIFQVNDIPKTQNGKTAELSIKELINGRKVNNCSALANPECLIQYQNLFLNQKNTFL